MSDVAATAEANPVSPAADQSAADMMLVRIGGGSYALPVASVREIVRLPQVTRVPGLPSFVVGLTNVRGRVLAVLDLRPLLRLDAPRGDRLIILDGSAEAASGTAPVTVGLIVDAALDLVQLPEGGLEPLPPGVCADAGAVLDGITVLDGTPVAVLSPPGVFGLRRRLGRAA